MHAASFRRALIAATILSSQFVATEALADCVSQAPVSPEQIVCDDPGTLGWDGSGTNGIVVTVNSGATVNARLASWPALISTGTGSAVINFAGSFDPLVAPVFGIDAGSSASPAISVGAGSIVTNDSGAAIRGVISFGDATGTTTNVLNNNYSSSGGVNFIGLIDGDVSAAGNFTLNNLGVMGWNADVTVTQTGAGAVNITNGVDGGYAAAFTGAYTYQNGFIWGQGTVISTEGNTTLVNRGGGGALGGLIHGDIVLGTGATGTSTLTNGSVAFGNATIIGNVTMADKDNTVTNDGTITGNVTMNGTGSNTYNAGSLGSAGDNGLRLPGSQIDGTGAATGTVTGTLTGLAANSANNVLNLNGTGSSALQAGSNIVNFGVVNKNNTGTWTIKNTLDGAAGKLTSLNVTGGTLSTDNAAFLGSAATLVKLSDGTMLNFNGTANGTFAGNIVDASAATTGAVSITGAGITTLSGANSYSGTTTIDGGTLVTGSDGALSANSAFFIQNGGSLIVNHDVAVKALVDLGAGPNTVNLNGADTSLTLTEGAWGLFGGTVIGTGTLIKSGTGDWTLDGPNAVNLTGPGSFRINDGLVTIAVANAISTTTAVQVNSTAGTTGVLNVTENDTIGSLAGTGSNATVNIATGKTLTTGGLNTSTSYAGKILGAGSLVKDGSGLMTLTGANAYTGGTTVNGGAIIGFVGTGASITGDYTLNNDAFLTFDQLLPPSGPQSGTYAGNVTGAATAYMQFGGNGTTKVTLTGDNSGFAGTTALGFGASTIGQGGTVSIGSASNIGTGTLLFYDGVLETTATMTLANAVSLQTTGGGGTFNTADGTTLTLAGLVTGSGALLKTGTGTLELTFMPSHTGGTTIAEGTLRTHVWSFGGDIVNNANLELIGCQPPTNIACFHNGIISGTGNVRITGDSGVAFGVAHTYTGTTTIDAGSALSSWAAGALSAQSSFVVNGALFLGSFDQTIGSLSGTGVVSTGDKTLNIGANNSSTTFAGTFGAYLDWYTESANINKIGTGTLTLSGTGSVLTGNLGVNAGTLSLTGTLTSATTTVASGAILSVDGTLTSPAVTVDSGGRLVGGIGTAPGNIAGAVTNNGTVAPGHSPGIIAISGSYAQTSTGTYAAEVFGNGTSTVVAGVDYDRIAVSGTPGTATLAGTLAVTPNGGLYVAGTTYDIITTTGGITGNFTTVSGNVISPFITLSNATASGGGVVGNNYRLVVVRSAYNTVATNPNQVAVANGLTGIIGSAGAASTVTKIDNMTAAQAQALFNSASPEPYGAYATALQDQGELFTRQVAQRQAATHVEEPDTGVWVNMYGSWGNGKDRGDYRVGNDHSIVGGAAGVDFGTGNLRVGLAGGYSEDDVTYLGGNSEGKNKSWQVGGYLSYAMDKVRIDGQVAYISGDITASKLDIGLYRLKWVEFARRNLLERCGVVNEIDATHCAHHRLEVANIADIELELVALVLLAHVILLLLVATEDTDFAKIGFQEATQDGISERASAASYE